MGRLFTEYFTKALFDEDGEFEHTSNKMHERFLAKQTVALASSTPVLLAKKMEASQLDHKVKLM